ncbi:MAG: outer membrane protein transport protein [Candidatus Hydrogenedentes bacterium]|nr:outer membrane protein transport protein [Candidatus Hydrogenedentota bacterium]
MKRACLLSLCSLGALLLFAQPAQAQLEITSAPSPVGSGARAIGMGSAFIAVADDATAASWNPAGLTQLERPELSLVYSFKFFEEDFNSEVHPGLDFSNEVDLDEINYASFVYPIPRTFGGRNVVLSLNYLRQYNFNRDLDFNFNDIQAGAGGAILGFRSNYKYSQRGGLSTISPAIGFEITDKLSVGLAYNIWDQSLLGSNEWKTRNKIQSRAFINGTLLPEATTYVDENFDNFKGRNFTAGALYKPTERLSLGAVYHSKFTADVTYSQVVRVRNNGFFGMTRTKRNRDYTFPSAFGLGAAYRFPNDKLTLSLDITRTEWDQFEILDPDNRNPYSRRRSGVTGQALKYSEVDPTYTVRLGAEYVFVNATKPKQDYLPSLRGGIFYDPEPSGGRATVPFGLGTFGRQIKGDGDPVDFWGFSLGAGVLVKDRVNLDIAYVYRWGDEARTDTFGLATTSADVEQHTLYFSTVVYF